MLLSTVQEALLPSFDQQLSMVLGLFSVQTQNNLVIYSFFVTFSILLTLFTSFTLYAIFSLHFKHQAPIESLDSHLFFSPVGAISIICSHHFVLLRFILNRWGPELFSNLLCSPFSSSFASMVQILRWKTILSVNDSKLTICHLSVSWSVSIAKLVN
jgi:hypothetical protein